MASTPTPPTASQVSHTGTWVATLSIGFSKTKTTIAAGLPLLEKYVSRARKCRLMGSAALDLAYVACGRLDAFWEMGLSSWDMAAGALMIQEAGGLVGDLQGEAGFLDKGEIAAATPKVFPQLLAALK